MKNTFTNGNAMDFLSSFTTSSVDLIFTSPPDISQAVGELATSVPLFLGFQKEFCAELARIVKPEGFICIPQTDRRHNAQIMANHVTYINEMCGTHGLKLKDEKIICRHPPADRVDIYKMTFQYMSVFTEKGTFKRKGRYLPDIFIDDQKPNKLLKGTPEWTQEFCDTIIETLTKPGGYVLDPFAAAAPVLRSAKRLGRDYCGFEILEPLHAAGNQLLEEVNVDV